MGKVTKELLSNDTGKEIKNSIDNLRDTVIAANTAKYDKEATLLEVTDARGGYTSLGQRLNNQDTKIEEEKGSLLTINRIYRQFIENGKYIDNSLNENYFGNIQGCTYIDNNKIIVACMSSDTSHVDNNLVKLMEIDISNGTLIRQNILELNHANSLAYDKNNNYLYVVSGSKYENGSIVADYKLFKINYETLDIINTKTFTDHISGVAYDNEKDRLIVGYIADRFYELDEYLNIITTYEIDKPSYINSAGIQSFELHDNKLYCLTIKPDTMVVYDLVTRGTSKIYSFPKYSNGDNFYIGEIEDISYIGNNKFLIFSAALTTYYSQQNQLNVFEINFKTNVLDNNTYLVERGYLANNVCSVYVDKNSTSINPNGSQNKPFKEIFEAIALLNSSRYKGNGRIYVANGVYKNIFFYGNNIEIEAKTTANPDVTIEGVIVSKSNVSFENCKFIKNNTNLDYPIEVEKSHLLLSNATVNSIDDYGIHSVESEINVRGSVISSDDVSSSNNKYMFYLDNGSILKMQQGVSAYKHIYFASQGAHIQPSRYQLVADSTIHYGEIDLGKTRYALDNNIFKFIVFKCLVNSKEQTFKFPTNIESWQIETSYIGNSTSKINMCSMTIEKTETGINITSNHWARYTGEQGDTWTNTSKTNNTINENFIILKSIELTDEP